MIDFSELYQQLILDHNRHPRNFGRLENATAVKEGFNPYCGDHIQLYLRMEDDVVQGISFEATGCAISKASASIMTTLLKGKSKAEARALFAQFHELATEETDEPPDLERLGDLAVFAGVHEFPARVKCATLAWHAMKAAIEGDEKIVTTE